MPEEVQRTQAEITRKGWDWTLFNRLAAAGLSPYEEFVYEWFWKLSTERPASDGGPRPIPFSRMEQRLQRFGLLGTPEGEDLLHLWQLLDRAYSKHCADKLKAAMNKATKGHERPDS